MQKLLAVKIRNTHEFSNQDPDNIRIDFNLDESHSFSAEILSQTDNWLNGNIFLGPSNRGPFDPSFDQDEDELLSAFEFNVAPIIDRDHFKKLILLYSELGSFIHTADDMDSVERLTDGFNLFISMIVVMNEYDVTMMNREQWEFREPMDVELNNVKDEKLRRELRNKKYWIIKKKIEDLQDQRTI